MAANSRRNEYFSWGTRDVVSFSLYCYIAGVVELSVYRLKWGFWKCNFFSPQGCTPNSPFMGMQQAIPRSIWSLEAILRCWLSLNAWWNVKTWQCRTCHCQGHETVSDSISVIEALTLMWLYWRPFPFVPLELCSYWGCGQVFIIIIIQHLLIIIEIGTVIKK